MRAVSPEVIRMVDLGRRKVLAISWIRAVLAAPSVGAVVTLALR